MPSAGRIKAGDTFVRMSLDANALEKGLRSAQQRLKRFSASAIQTGQRLGALSASLAAPQALALGIFSKFSDKMATVRAVTQATESQFEQLTEEAQRLGRTTSFTAQQVAGAMIELGRAGFDPTQILFATESVLNLARASDTELPRAAEIAGAALRGFNLEASESVRVADVLTTTVNGSAQTLEDLFEAFKPVAPIAQAAGASIEDTSAALAILANNGIKGSLAGNALARAYKNLSTKDAQDQLRAVGVEAVDVNGNLRPVADILRELGSAVDSLGSAERLNLFESLFGRGQAAALKLSEGGAVFDDLVTKIRGSAGSAARIAQEMDDNLGGSFRRILSAAEGLAIALGRALSGPVRIVVDALTRVIGATTKFVEENKGIAIGIAAATVAIGGLAGGLLALGAAAGVASFAIGGLIVLVKAIAVVVGVILSPIGLAVAGILALGAAQVFVLAKLGLLQRAFKAITNFISPIFGPIKRVAAVLKKDLGSAITGIKDSLAVGDYKLAARILFATLKLEYARGTEALLNIWIRLKDRLLNVPIIRFLVERFKEGVRAIKIIWSGLKEAITRVIEGLRVAWEKFIDVVERRGGILLKLAKLTPAFQLGKLAFQADEDRRDEGPSIGDRAAQKRARDRVKQAEAEKEALERLAALKRRQQQQADEPQDTGAAPPSAGGGEFQTSDAIRLTEFQQSLEDRLHDLRIANIEDELTRDLTAIDTKYDREVREAQAAGEAIERIEQARDLERRNRLIAAVRERAKERERLDKEQAEVSRDIADETARLKIEAATPQGLERQLRLLDLERRQALRDAAPADRTAIQGQFDLRARIARQQDSGIISPRSIGTFSAQQVRALGGGGDSRQVQLLESLNRRAQKQEEFLRRIADAQGAAA